MSKISVIRDLLSVTADRTSPAAAGFAVTTPVSGMSQYSSYTLYVTIAGGVGGTLDVVIEQSPDVVDWYEFSRFTQLAAAAAPITYMNVKFPANQAILVVGKNLTTTMAIGSGIAIAVPAFDFWRVRYIAGANTSAGSVQNIKVMCVIDSWQ